ncbi:hypothetical protein JYU03_00325, partial [bacterium AH-315-F03]|nr:hypothetical protein [bacterium AH-315-F03]
SSAPIESPTLGQQLEATLSEHGVELRAQVEELFALLEDMDRDSQTDVTMLMAQLFETRGLHVVAGRLYESVCSTVESEDTSLYRYALCLTDLGEYNRAVELMTICVRAKPLYADYRNALGIALAWSGKISEAFKQFDHALELNTYYADAHYCSGIVCLFNGIKGIEPSLTQDFVARSLKSLEKSVVIDDAIATTEYLHAVARLQDGDIREAFGVLRRNREMRQAARRSSYEEIRADLLSRMRSTDRHAIVNRIRALVHQLSENPEYVDLSYDLATSYLRLAVCEWQTGLKQFQQTLERNPDLKKAVRAHDIAFSTMSDLNTIIENIDQDRLSAGGEER